MDETKPQDTKRSRLMQVFLGFITNLSNLAPGITLGFSAILLPALYKANPDDISEDDGSWIASAASITMPIGCFISGPLLDKLGRKWTLYIVNVVSIIGWIFIAAASTDPYWMFIMLLTGRIITGIATGLGSIPATVYLSEISTPKLRATLATWTSVFIAVGVFIIYLLGYFIRENWRINAGITLCIPIIALVCIFFIMPESPQWLVGKNRIEEAEQSLARIWRIPVNSPYIKEEIEKMNENVMKTKSVKIGTKSLPLRFRRKFENFTKPGCIKPFMIMVSFFFFQQFAGCFVIVFYAVTIVEETGIQTDKYLIALIIGLARVIASFMVGPICRRFGRRPPSIFSGIGMSACMIALAGYMFAVYTGTVNTDLADSLNWLPVLFLVLYFFTSTLGFLTIPFAMMGEMYPAKMRGLAGGMTACACYIFNFITVKTYPQMRESMHDHGLYGFYGAIAVVGTIFVIFFLPETKGKTLQEIEDSFSNGNRLEKMDERTELKDGHS